MQASFQNDDDEDWLTLYNELASHMSHFTNAFDTPQLRTAVLATGLWYSSFYAQQVVVAVILVAVPFSTAILILSWSPLRSSNSFLPIFINPGASS